VGTVQRTRNTRARLDRDTPDFSAYPGEPARSLPVHAATILRSPPHTITPKTPVLETASVTPSTPNRARSPSNPSTPATFSLIRTYAQMIENAGDPSRGKRRSWWSRIFSR
jgi:hypothetical protein